MASTLGEAHFFEESMNSSKVRSYLASNKEAETSRGMKFLLANMSKGRDMSEFFPDVVKNVVVRSVEVKKMVYMYLVQYADATPACRELALLSINSFQKDLAASNQLIRALALRVMTSIRVPDIIQIQLLAVFKCASDSSPYVRRCAATAVPKIHALDPSQLPQLVQALERLLRDSSTMVLGAAVAAFNEVCPTRYELLHRCYRKLCHLLADMDEWTQIAVLNVLARYVRTQFTDPAPGARAAVLARARARSGAAVVGASAAGGGVPKPVKVKRRVVKKAFYSDEEDVSEEEEVEVVPVGAGQPVASGGFGGFGAYPPAAPSSQQQQNALFARGADAELDTVELDPDHKLLLRSSLPLLKSRNCGVVLAVCALHYYCGTQGEATAAQLGKSLVRISRNRREIAYGVLKAIAAMAQERPHMFRPFLQDFFVKATDPAFCRALKLDILTALTDGGNVAAVLRELQSYVKHADKDFVCAAVRAVGRVADAQPGVADRCLRGLMALLAAGRSEKVAGQAVVVIRQLLQQQQRGGSGAVVGIDRETTVVVTQLAQVLISEKGRQVPPAARASLIWVVGEFLPVLQASAPDVLRLLARGFPEEEPAVKMQIVNLAAKLYIHQHSRKMAAAAAAAATTTSGGGSGGSGSGSLLMGGNGRGNGGQGQGEGEGAVDKLVRYVLEVARFDTNYDIRDRTRALTACLGLAAGGGKGGDVDAAALVALRAKAEEVFLAPKLPPLTLMGPVAVEGLPNLTISSLSWMLNHKVPGYQELPDWAVLPPDPSVRDAPKAAAAAAPHGAEGATGGRPGSASEFYSDEEDEEGVFRSESGSGSASGSSYSSELDSYSGSGSGSSESGSESEASETESEEEERGAGGAGVSSGSRGGSGSSYSSSSSNSDSGSSYSDDGDDESSASEGSESEGSESGKEGRRRRRRREERRSGYDELGFGLGPAEAAAPGGGGGGDGDGLLDLEAYASSKQHAGGTASSSNVNNTNDLAALIQGMGAASLGTSSSTTTGASVGGAAAVLSAWRELLRPEVGGGLRVDHAFTREADAGPTVCALRLRLHNARDDAPLRRVKVTAASSGGHARLLPFPELPLLEPGASADVRIGVDLLNKAGAGGSSGSSSGSVVLKLQFATDRGTFPATLKLPPEELLRPHPGMTAAEAAAARKALGGFHECKASFPLPPGGGGGSQSVPERVLRSAALALVSPRGAWEEEGTATFAALARGGSRGGAAERVVVSVALDGEWEGEGGDGEGVALQVNCDDAMLSAMLLDVLKRGVLSSSP